MVGGQEDLLGIVNRASRPRRLKPRTAMAGNKNRQMMGETGCSGVVRHVYTLPEKPLTFRFVLHQVN